MSMQPQYAKAGARLEHSEGAAISPLTTLPNDIYLEIAMERQRQDAKWGEQNWPIRNEEAALTRYYKDAAQLSKELCDKMASLGTLTWRDILKEEFDEVFAEGAAKAQRVELVQVAAVAVAMIECIDRKTRAIMDNYIDWSKVPEGYDWVAVDSNGIVYAYDTTPDAAYAPDMWCVGKPGDQCKLIDNIAIIGPLPPWRESLRERPRKEL